MAKARAYRGLLPGWHYNILIDVFLPKDHDEISPYFAPAVIWDRTRDLPLGGIPNGVDASPRLASAAAVHPLLPRLLPLTPAAPLPGSGMTGCVIRTNARTARVCGRRSRERIRSARLASASRHSTGRICSTLQCTDTVLKNTAFIVLHSCRCALNSVPLTQSVCT